MGGPEKISARDAGRLTVRERIAALLDEGSFHEVGALAGTASYDESGDLANFTPANFVTGTGRLDGRKVVVGGDDFTVRGGAADASIIGKQIYAERLANELHLPIVRLVEGTGGGGSVKTLETTGHTYVHPSTPAGITSSTTCRPFRWSRPGSARWPAWGRPALRGPPVDPGRGHRPALRGRTAGGQLGTGERVDKEQLGGSRVHAKNGAVDLIAASEAEAFSLIRRFLSYLPPSVFELPPVAPNGDPVSRRAAELLAAVPRDRRQPYRIRPILAAVFDAGSVMEVQRYGGSIVTALARLDGHPVGVVAGNCTWQAAA